MDISPKSIWGCTHTGPCDCYNNKNNMTHYEEYAIIEAQIKELENKKDSLRGLILKEMVESGEEAVDTAVGKFSVTRLKKWTYPESVTSLKDKYDAEKARAESTGEATYTESESLRFTKIKL